MKHNHKPKHHHLLPIVSFVPVIALLFVITYYDWKMSPAWAALIAVTYFIANVVYRLFRHKLNSGEIVEYFLLALLFLFVAIMYV